MNLSPHVLPITESHEKTSNNVTKFFKCFKFSFFLLVIQCFFICCEPLAVFQSSDKVGSVNFVSFLKYLWKDGLWELLTTLFF